jgi:replicative DNA helicase
MMILLLKIRWIQMNIEKIILSNLVHNEEYGRRVVPFLHSEYFAEPSDKVVFELIDNYVKKYNAFPSIEAVSIDLSNKTGINEEQFKQAVSLVSELSVDKTTKLEWLLDSTENWCQTRSLHLALLKSIMIMDESKKDSKQSRGAIPQILTDALAVSFNVSVGHDYIEDASDRFDFYRKKEKRLPFDLHYLNEVTHGGLPSKTLNMFMASVGAGKTMLMCHMAAANLSMGYKVLYITLEMAKERIAERIDANLLNIGMDELKFIEKSAYEKRIEKLRGATNGKLIIEEFPTACAGAANFRYLLNELKIKKNFRPDIIYVDYLNICMSSRIKYGNNVSSYHYIKAIAEELRGLAVEQDLPIVSATQVNRSGSSSSDMEMEDVSESWGLPATCDLLMALITSDELSALGQIMVKQLKNRYGDININTRFVLGVDRNKMRFYDCEHSAQRDVSNGSRTKDNIEKKKRKSLEDVL